MNKHVYNLSILAGVSLVGIGIGLHDLGAGLATAGALVIALTLFGAFLSTRSRG